MDDRSALADAARRLRAQLAGERSVRLYGSLGAHLTDAATGGALFLVGVSGAQLLQRALHVGAATPVVPRVVGALAVGASSAAALHFASLPRDVLESLAADRAKASTVQWRLWGWSDDRSANTMRSALNKARDLADARARDFWDAPYPVYMLMGVLCFKMLGGRMSALAPSHFADLGAFHLKKASLPATADYATPVERGVIQEFGRLYGCHTCGVRRGVRYHADHMPPKLVAKRRDGGLLRRLTGRKTSFRFYPQCEPCSNQQGSVVKQWKTTLRTHLTSVRIYHSTGVWLVLLCTGGLYVGGSSFHETSDLAFQADVEDESADAWGPQLSQEFSLLTALRERERQLRRQRKRTTDPALVAAIDKEVDALEKCKLQQREQGWNDRFFYEPPSNSNKLPRPDRPVSIKAHSPVAKERKIRDERAQYGATSNGKQEAKRRTDAARRPQHSKLMPLGSLPRPPTEKQDPTREEKLRFKVLKLVDARETLLYQLSALILCTPVQESVFMPSRPTEPPRSMGGSSGRQMIWPKAGMAIATTSISSPGGLGRGGGGGAMTNAREATKMAQKIATDLQEVGIQCVEALVEWMLEAGAKAEKPPPFLWRGRNYFLKMQCDLDFAEAELRARGVCLDCYTQKNPLLIRPEQKLGRVLAAQSIINEMIEMASEPTPQEVLEHAPSLAKKTPETGGGRANTSDESPLAPQDSRNDTAPQDAINLLNLEGSDRGGGIESERSEYSEDSAAGSGEPDDRNNSGEDASGHDSEDDEAKDVLSEVVERDPEAEVELVTMLDDSLSNFPNFRPLMNSRATASEEVEEVGNDDPSSARTEASNQSAEYDDSNFEDEENAANGDESVAVDSSKQLELVAAGEVENDEDTDPSVDTSETADEVSIPAMTDTTQTDNDNGTADPDKSEEEPQGDDGHDTPGEELHDDNHNEMSEDRPTSALPVDVTVLPPKETLLDELEKWARNPLPRTSLLVGALESLEWQGTDALETAVRESASPMPSLESSLLWAVTESLLVPPTPQLHSFLGSDTSRSLDVRALLRRECYVLVCSVCSGLASLLERALVKVNPLISEIEVGEVLEVAESVFRSQDDIVWKYVGVATSLLTPEYLRDADNNSSHASCQGLNDLVNIFYPYLTNQPRERLPKLWSALSRLLARYFLRVDDLAYMLAPALKSMLLVVASLSGERISGLSDAPVDSAAVPKLTLVCERGDVLRSSTEAVWTKRLSLPPASSRGSDQVFPFFRSPFGEKLVEGFRVEEGEGRGPLKEWFSLLGQELVAKWRPLTFETPTLNALDSSGDTHLATASGNRLVLPPSVAHLARPGLQVEWDVSSLLESPGEVTVTHIINAQDSSGQPGTFLLDRIVSSQSFAATQLRLAEPRVSVFEYVQASEAFYLNAQTADSPENRRTLTFAGWLFATAVTHSCSVSLRLHPLVFTLLLDRGYCVSLDDVRAFDPTLSKSLEQVKRMPAPELAVLLELEGADVALSADEYVASVLDSKFGPTSGIGWQLDAMRQGFDAVVSLELVAKLGITGHDLAVLVDGTDAAVTTGDFSIERIFRVAVDSDFAACRPLQRGFWRAANAFEPPLKRKLVKFITGVDTLPRPGTEFLRIEMPFPSLSASDHAKNVQMLPQAHTCDNTLELPHYWKALCWQRGHDEDADDEQLEAALVDLVASKLRAAVEYSEGYGLDGTSSAGDELLVETRLTSQDGDADAIEREESYESLDLPALQSGEHGNVVDETEPVDAPRADAEEGSALLDQGPSGSTSETTGAESSGPPKDEDGQKEGSEDEYDDWEEEEEDTTE